MRRAQKCQNADAPSAATLDFGDISVSLQRTLAHFLRSSICSTSLDSSTTLPFTMVWVTTLTIFLVLTSGSSVTQERVRFYSHSSFTSAGKTMARIINSVIKAEFTKTHSQKGKEGGNSGHHHLAVVAFFHFYQVPPSVLVCCRILWLH